MKKIFAILMFIIAVKMLFFDKPHKEDKPKGKAAINSSTSTRDANRMIKF